MYLGINARMKPGGSAKLQASTTCSSCLYQEYKFFVWARRPESHKDGVHRYRIVALPPTASSPHRFPHKPRVSTMNKKPHQLKHQDSTISSLNIAIEFINLAKEASSVTPAKAVFGSVSIILSMIKVSVLLVPLE
jgi:hypothetical protein